jgi:multimeric flavodoxin WrbA
MSTQTNPKSVPKMVVINGGPRKGWNTTSLLEHSAEGARAEGASIEWVDLYEIDFKGCRSCLACKIRDGKSYGHCAQRDGLSPVLDQVEKADALLIGSPIYFGSVTGETRSFLERMLFPWFTYTDPYRSLLSKRIPVGVIYTMNLGETQAEELGYWRHLERTESALEMILGRTERLASFDTLQTKDYSKLVASRWDPVHKEERHRDVFPQDCAKARELGRRLIQQ